MEALYEEVAYITYYFHWPLDDVLNLEHADRHRWIEQISRINRKLNGDE